MTASSRPVQRISRRLKPYLFLLPMLVFAVAFVYYPFLKTMLYSLFTVNARGELVNWAGLDNFTYMFSRREFSAAMTNTLRLTLLNVPLTLGMTILMAMLCNRRRRTSVIYETMYMLPMAVAMSAITLIFKVLLNPTVGWVNAFFGLHIGWYKEKATAFYSILLLTVWMGLGFNFLLFLSAFRNVPEQLLESARLDGAGVWTCFWRIQLPMVTPTILYVFCTNMVQAMMTNGPVMILTQGGPSRSTTTLIYMMYTSGYRSSNYSMAACVSIVTFLMTLIFTVAAFAINERKVHYQ